MMYGVDMQFYIFSIMTALSMPEAVVACVAMICVTVFLTVVTIKGMDSWKKKE